MRNAVVFLCQEHPRAELYSIPLCPRWFRLVFLGNASNQNDAKGIILLALLVSVCSRC